MNSKNSRTVCVKWTANRIYRYSPPPSTSMIFVLLLICMTCFANGGTLNGWPECTNATYTADNNMINVDSVLYSCVENIPGNNIPPSYFNASGVYAPTNVKVGFVINNLISVDDLTSVITMDFYLRLLWNDSRLNMPFLFDSLNPEVEKEGIDITNSVRNTGVPLNIWLPDIVFYQSIEIDVIAELIKLYKGSIYWSRHMLVSFAEPQMNFKRFPMDRQNFSMVLQSYAHDTEFVALELFDPAVVFVYDDQQEANYVTENQLWVYDKFSAYTVIDDIPSPQNPSRQYSTAYFNIAFTRQPLGIIYRLSLPVTILLLIVGFSFWTELDDRVSVTVNMLLVVAALYIVIGQVIPFVGYLSQMDIFITTVFVLLTVVVGLSFALQLMERKIKQYPMNIFRRDLTEYIFRTLWIPGIVFLFVYIFDISLVAIKVLLYVSVAITLANAVLKIQYLKRSFKASVLLLRQKELKILSIKQSIAKTSMQQHSAPDSDDEFNEEFEEVKQELKPESNSKDDDDSEEKSIQWKKKVRRFKLSKLEVFVLNHTRHLYNKDLETAAAVFGVHAVVQNAEIERSASIAQQRKMSQQDGVILGVELQRRKVERNTSNP